MLLLQKLCSIEQWLNPFLFAFSYELISPPCFCLSCFPFSPILCRFGRRRRREDNGEDCTKELRRKRRRKCWCDGANSQPPAGWGSLQPAGRTPASTVHLPMAEPPEEVASFHGEGKNSIAGSDDVTVVANDCDLWPLRPTPSTGYYQTESAASHWPAVGHSDWLPRPAHPLVVCTLLSPGLPPGGPCSFHRLFGAM